MNMALSKKDHQFYTDKLSLKWVGSLFLYTILVGAVGLPSTLYMQDASAGMAGKWSVLYALNVAVVGGLLGCVVAAVMYIGFRLLLHMGWLPSRG